MQFTPIKAYNKDAIELDEPLIHPGFYPYVKAYINTKCVHCFACLSRRGSLKCHQCGKKSMLIPGKSLTMRQIKPFIQNDQQFPKHLLTWKIPVVNQSTIPKMILYSKEIKDVIEIYYDKLRNPNYEDKQNTWNKIVANDKASFKHRLSGKKGRFRNNLCGKRSNYSARCTLTPNCDLPLNEVIIPRSFSSVLTIPERCNRYNYIKLKHIMETKKANAIQKKNKKISLLYSIPPLEIGDIVYRHLQEDDYILVNRQPTLERTGMMAHKVKFHDHNTCALNVTVCPSYGADFDGDEINLHCIQTIEARTDLETLMDVYENMDKCKPIQDIVLYQYYQEDDVTINHDDVKTNHDDVKTNHDDVKTNQVKYQWISNHTNHEYEVLHHMSKEYLMEKGITVGWEDIQDVDNGTIFHMVDAKSKGKPQNIEEIKTKYQNGLDSDSFFQHMCEGRSALVDSSILTAQTGYLQRCLIKNFEDVTMTWIGIRGPRNVFVTFMDDLESKYVAGDAVGIRIAQTVGEISTQLSLDSFHNVGSENNTFTMLKKILLGTETSEIMTTYGIEAAFLYYRRTLQELLELPEYDITVLLDWITWSGNFDKMNHVTLRERSDSVLTKASFERTSNVLFNAAANEKVDPLLSVTSQVITGKIVGIGTGNVVIT